MTSASNLLTTTNAAAGARKSAARTPIPAGAQTRELDFESVLREFSSKDGGPGGIGSDEVELGLKTASTKYSEEDPERLGAPIIDPTASIAASLQLFGLPPIDSGRAVVPSTVGSTTPIDDADEAASGVPRSGKLDLSAGLAPATPGDVTDQIDAEQLNRSAAVADHRGIALSMAKDGESRQRSEPFKTAPLMTAKSAAVSAASLTLVQSASPFATGAVLKTTGEPAVDHASLSVPNELRPRTAIDGVLGAIPPADAPGIGRTTGGSLTRPAPPETSASQLRSSGEALDVGHRSLGAASTETRGNTSRLAELSPPTGLIAQMSAMSEAPNSTALGNLRIRSSAALDGGSDPGIELTDTHESRADQTRPKSTLVNFGQLPSVVGTLRFQNDEEPAAPGGLDRGDASSQFLAPQTVANQVTALLPSEVTINAPVASPQWAEALGSAVLRMTTDQISDATLTMNPNELGAISIKISVDGSNVSVGFTADSNEVRQAVNNSLPVLQDMLAQAGLSLGHSSVSQENAREPAPFSRHAAAAANSSLEPIAAAAPAPRPRPSGSGRIDLFA